LKGPGESILGGNGKSKKRGGAERSEAEGKDIGKGNNSKELTLGALRKG